MRGANRIQRSVTETGPALREGRRKSSVGWARDSGYSWAYAGGIWALVISIALPSDLFGGAPLDPAQAFSPNPVTRFLKLAELTIALLLILRRASLAWVLFRALNPFLVAFLVLAPLSMLWSIDPGATLGRFIAFMSIVALCFAFGLGGWHAHRFQSVIRPAVTVVLIGSLIYGVLAPERAIEVGDGTLKNALHGLLSQKNQLGEAAGMGVLLWFHAYITKEVTSWRSLLGLLVAGTCLVATRSSASLLSTVFACTLISMLLRMPQNLRPYVPYLVAIFAIVVLIYAIAALNLVPGLDAVLTPITMMTGKDLTFSNRSEIWAIIEEHIRLSPYIGSGYGAYWTGLDPASPSYVFLARMYFYPTQSHNGYLEVINDLGILGFLVLLAYLGAYIRQALQLLRIDRAQATLFLCLFFQHLVANLSETAWLAPSSQLTTTVMTAATVCIARALLEQRFQRVWGNPASVRNER